MLEFIKAPFLVLHFFYYTWMTFLTMLSVILLSMLMILFSILSVIKHLISGNNLNWLLHLNLIYETLWINAGKTQLVLFEWSNNIVSVDVKIGGSVLEEKSYFKMLGLTFSSKLDWGSYIISIAKTAFKKVGTLIRSMKFLRNFYEVPFPSCYLELLVKLHKRICRTVGHSLATSLEPLAHRRNLKLVLTNFLQILWSRHLSDRIYFFPYCFFG